MNTVRALIDTRAATHRDSYYFIGTEEVANRVTFGELRDSCTGICAFLTAMGLRPGAHVSLVMPNGVATLRILLGAMYGGYCVNPVNLLSSPCLLYTSPSPRDS